jgi:hypothetical protein
LGELDEKPSDSKISKSSNYKGKGCNENIHFKNHLIKKYN